MRYILVGTGKEYDREIFDSLEEAKEAARKYREYEIINKYNNEWEKYIEDPNSGYLIYTEDPTSSGEPGEYVDTDF